MTSTPRPRRSPISTSGAGPAVLPLGQADAPDHAFLGTSENAVRIQIIVALIAHMLLRLAQAAQTAVESPIAFARLVRANLMHRRRIDRLLTTSPPAQSNAPLVLAWN